MTDAIDAVDPDNIGPEWDGLPIIRATVLADPAGQLFDSESGNAGVDTVARAILLRQQQQKWSVGYTNEDNEPALSRAFAALELRWLGVEQWPTPGPYLHAAAPTTAPGTVPAWCPVAPVAVQDRWVGGAYDLSTIYGAYPARVLGYIDGPVSRWPAAAWERFQLIPDSSPPPPPPPTPAPVPQPSGRIDVQFQQVQQGSTGYPVRSMQALVNYYGAKGLVADGVFGPITRAAVVRFQEAHQLTPDGIVGVHTWGMLIGVPQ